jgi:hypothetical protein
LTNTFTQPKKLSKKKNDNQLNPKNDQPSALPDLTSQNKVDNEMRTTHKQTQNPSPAAHTNPPIQTKINKEKKITITQTKPQTTRSILVSSTDSPITLSNLSLEISEIKPINQSTNMIIDDTIHNLNTPIQLTSSTNTTANQSYNMEIDNQPSTSKLPETWSPSFEQGIQKDLEEIRNNKDIREFEHTKEETLELANTLFTNPTNIPTIINIITTIKSLTILPPHYYQAILNKLNFNDRTFFASFSREADKKPAHQKEFEELEKEFIINYKQDHKIRFINFETKKKLET